jgi:hypothetical protein
MLEDGTQGTSKGDGLVQLLDKFGNAYSAVRGYNSGDVGPSGDLGDAIGATKCYVSDIANRMMGWVSAPSKCDEDASTVSQSAGTPGQAESDGSDATSGQQQEQPPSDSGSSQQSSSVTDSATGSSTGSSTSGANSDGTFSGGHWDINGNYVKGDTPPTKRKIVFKG